MQKTLSNLGVAITRPMGQAKKLQRLIHANGGEPISFPLIKIVALQDYSLFDKTIERLESYDWAIFISSNAVQMGMPKVLARFTELPLQLKLAAIGPVTASELVQMCELKNLVRSVLMPENKFDSESLLSLPEMQFVQGKKIMIFRGIGGRDVLADILQARGAQVTFAECYQRINPQQNCLVLQQLWEHKKCQAIVVTSSEAMRSLIQMTNNGGDDWIRNILICVNHARVAEEAVALGLHVAIAAAPGDEAMLACLEQNNKGM